MGLCREVRLRQDPILDMNEDGHSGLMKLVTRDASAVLWLFYGELVLFRFLEELHQSQVSPV